MYKNTIPKVCGHFGCIFVENSWIRPISN